MTIVYGAGFKLGALLCHEAVHARAMLHGESRRRKHEEAEADRAMKNVALQGLRKGIIKVVRKKQ